VPSYISDKRCIASIVSGTVRISICNNFNNDGVCDILKGNISSSEQKLAYDCAL